MDTPRPAGQGIPLAVTTRIAPRVETLVGSLGVLVCLTVVSVILVSLGRGAIPWYSAAWVLIIALPAGAAQLAFIYLQFQHMRRAAYQVSLTRLQYWDWRRRHYVIPMSAILRLRTLMLPVPSLMIDYLESGSHTTLAIRFTHVWDDRFAQDLVRRICVWAQLHSRGTGWTTREFVRAESVPRDGH